MSRSTSDPGRPGVLALVAAVGSAPTAAGRRAERRRDPGRARPGLDPRPVAYLAQEPEGRRPRPGVHGALQQGRSSTTGSLEHEAVAPQYLAEHPDGPVQSLAQIVATMARAQAGQFAEALAALQGADGRAWASPSRRSSPPTSPTRSPPPPPRPASTTSRARSTRRCSTATARARPPRRRSRTTWPGSTRSASRRPASSVKDVDGETVPARRPAGASTSWSTSGRPGAPRASPSCRGSRRPTRSITTRGFEIVGVSLDETKSAVVDFVKARKLPWRQIHNATGGGDLVEAFGVSSIPPRS